MPLWALHVKRKIRKNRQEKPREFQVHLKQCAAREWRPSDHNRADLPIFARGPFKAWRRKLLPAED